MIVSCGEALVDVGDDIYVGGGPLNVAVAAARLGAPAAFVGRVSTDAHGARIWDHLVDNGVDVRAAERGEEATARAIVEHVPKLRFRFEGDNTADMMLSRAALEELGDGPHLVHGGTLGLFRGTTAAILADLVERHDGLVSLDPNVRPQMIDDWEAWHSYHRRWIARAHLYKASDEDLAWAWPGRSVDAVAEELLAGSALMVAVTGGPDGATLYVRDGVAHGEADDVGVVDTVGAGDTFAAALLVGLWQLGARTPATMAEIGLPDWTTLATRAVRAAEITCSRPGADPPRAAELDAVLASSER